MERCSVCGKSVKDLAEEALSPTKISIESELFHPFNVCEDCEAFLKFAISRVLEELGFVKIDEESGEFVRIK